MQPPACCHCHSYCRPTVTCGVLRGPRERHTDLRLCRCPRRAPDVRTHPGVGVPRGQSRPQETAQRPQLSTVLLTRSVLRSGAPAWIAVTLAGSSGPPRTPVHVCCCPAGTHTCGRSGTWEGGTPADSCRLSVCSFTEGTYCVQRLFPGALVDI